MIWMKRMHIINWMYYGIQTVEFEKSNLLTGITGSGKSSLIDALQVVILGETGCFFKGIPTIQGQFSRNTEYQRCVTGLGTEGLVSYSWRKGYESWLSNFGTLQNGTG